MRPRRKGPRGVPPAQVGANAPLILLVEDDPDERGMYAAYFKSQGFQVATAADGDQALRRAHKLLPSVIVMDLALPHVDGWEAARQLKRDPQTARIPIIACTAHVLRGAVEDAIVAGCDAYVTKPCLPEHLLVEIKRFLPRNEGALGRGRG
jgi:two-component system cell cycle response regulator DivK